MNHTPFSHSQRLSRFAGFTIIELLTVIAVVSVLSLILFQAFGKVSNRAQGVRCMNNLRNLQMANQLFANEHHGMHVGAWNYDSEGNKLNSWYWNHEFRSYLLSENPEQIWDWPADMLCPVAYGEQQSKYDTISASYGINDGALSKSGNKGEPNASFAVSINQLINPSETIAFADSTDWHIKGNSEAALTAWTGQEGKTGDGAVAYRHDGKAHVVFYDGSVSFMTMEESVSGEKSSYWLREE